MTDALASAAVVSLMALALMKLFEVKQAVAKRDLKRAAFLCAGIGVLAVGAWIFAQGQIAK